MSDAVASGRPAILADAHACAQRGWRVLPLHTPTADGGCSCKNAECSSPGKHPRTKNGCKDATTAAATIDFWWGQWPTANLGIATGEESGIVVIDVDPDHDGFATLVELESMLGNLPRETVGVTTGSGGAHIYMKYPTGARIGNSQARADMVGVDVRGEGGYVVAPASLHASGQLYAWTGEPTDVLAELPAAWMTAIAAGSSPGQRRDTSTDDPSTPLIEGARNQALTSLGGSMRRRGMSEAAICAALLAENTARCQPPLGEDEVRKIAWSVSRYEPADDPVAEATDLSTALERVAGLEEMLKSDVGAALTAPMVDALIVIEAADPPGFARVREVCRKGGVMMRALTKAMKDRRDVVGRERAKTELETGEGLDDAPAHLEMPPEFRVHADGVYTLTEEGHRLRILPVPLLVTRRLRGIDNGEERLELQYKRDGSWHKITCDRSICASSQAIIRLADEGLPVTSGTSMQVVKFLGELEAANLDTLPLDRCTVRAGWVGAGRFYPGAAADVVFAPEDATMVHAFGAHGSLEEWAAGLGGLRNKYPALRLSIAASVAAPLLKPLGHRNFILHLWGDSGSGKSAVMRAAMSVWGSRALVGTFNATAHALTNRAAMMCDIPCAFNERQLGPRNLDNVLYGLAEGVGKAQGAKAGGNRQVKMWRSIILTNGEEPITSSAGMQGTVTRTIEIEGAPIAVDAEAEGIHQLCDKQYGHAGRLVATKLAAELGAGGPGKLDEAFERMRDALTEACGSDRTAAHVSAVALMALGDVLASRWLFVDHAATRDPWAEAVQLGTWALDATADREETDQGERVYEFICNLYWQNHHRFNAHATDTFERWGEVVGDEVWFSSSALEEQLEKSKRSYRSSLRLLAQKDQVRTQMRGGKRRMGIRRKNQTFNVISIPGASDEKIVDSGPLVAHWTVD